MNLENISLQPPLEFIVDPEDAEKRKLGICIKEVSPDGKQDRMHIFNTQDGSYLGYHDRKYDDNFKLMLSSGGVDYSPKGQVQSRKKSEGMKNTFYKRRRGRIYQIGKKEVVLEEQLPALEQIDGVVKLVRDDKLPTLRRELTAREKLELEAESRGKSLAEIYGERDGSLRDESSMEVPKRVGDEHVSEPPQEAKFDHEGKARFDFEGQSEGDQETPGMGTY